MNVVSVRVLVQDSECIVGGEGLRATELPLLRLVRCSRTRTGRIATHSAVVTTIATIHPADTDGSSEE